MYRWDEISRQENFEQRLLHLPAAKRISFAAGCIEHLIRESLHRFRDFDENSIEPLQQLLRSIWSQFPDDVDTTAINRHLAILEDFLEIHESGKVNLYDLVMAAIYLCLTATHSAPVKSAKCAYDAACYAYQVISESIFNFYDTSLGEDELYEIEKEAEVCLKELSFQISYLSVLENLQTEIFTYEAVLKEMK